MTGWCVLLRNHNGSGRLPGGGYCVGAPTFPAPLAKRRCLKIAGSRLMFYTQVRPTRGRWIYKQVKSTCLPGRSTFGGVWALGARTALGEPSANPGGLRP